MAVVNDSIQINAPKPLDKWYMIYDVTARPYNGIAEVMSTVNVLYRYEYQTFNITVSGETDEYWFKGGTAQSNLVKKSSSTVVTEPPVTPSVGWRHATQADVGVIPNASVGDFIITGANDGSNIRVRPTYSNVFTLDLSTGPKKILIKGGDYARIELWMDLKGGDARDITITNYDGQVRCVDVSLGGLQGINFTGKYDPIAKTGDSNFRGHDSGYANTSGKYGFYISNGWGTLGKFLFEMTAITKTDGTVQVFDNADISYIEAGNGGFTNMFKYDNIDAVVNGVTLHDVYFHDIHSEGIYLGSTSNSDPQVGFRNVNIYNSRFLRMGSDGIQLNQLLDVANVENCVIHAAVNWRSPFQANQDFGISIGVRNGGFRFRNNIVIGGSAFFQVFTKRVSTTLYPNFVSSGVVEIHNNLFMQNVGINGGYIGNTTNIPNIAFKITNNDFIERTFLYDQVYNVTDVSQLIRYANDAPLTLTDNRWDASQGKSTALVVSSGFSPVVTQGNNSIQSVATANFSNYMGFAPGFNYTNYSDWTGLIGATYGDEGAFPSSGTKKGQPMSYVANQHYVSRKSRFYKCIQSHSTPIEPGVATNWTQYWELMTFNGQFIPTDDVRLTASDYHNSLGRGLLDNPTPVGTTCAAPTNPQTSGITNNSASASWLNAAGFSSYAWELYNTNLAGSLVTSGTVNTNVLTFNNLNPSATYQLRVKTNCLNGGTSNWTAFNAFTTQANPVLAPDTLNLAAYDEGGQYELKFGPNRAVYTTEFRLAGIGSSTLSGTGPTVAAERIGDRIQTALNTYNGRFYNNAISGKDSSHGLPTGQTFAQPNINITMAISSRPDAILVMFPSNDIQNGFTANEFAQHLIDIFNEGQKYGIPTFITGTQPRDGYTAPQQALLVDTNNLLKAAIPAKFFIDVLDLLRDTTNPGGKTAQILPAYAAGDTIHLNGAGHSILFNAIMPKIEAYFADQNTLYNRYDIEYGTTSAVNTPPSVWTSLENLTDTTLASKLYNRVDGQIYGYRYRARKVADNTYTSYSNVAYLQQAYLRTDFDQTINIDFSVDTNGADTSGLWNNFNAPSSGPAVGSELNLLDQGGNPTPVKATVTKVFLNANTGGASSGLYPIKVMQDGWAVTRSNADRAQMVISGLSPTNAYRFTMLSSKNGASVAINRATGIWANGKFNGSPSTLPQSVSPNQFEVGVLEGVISDGSGNVTIDVYPVGDVGFLNTLVIQRYAASALVCATPTLPVNSSISYQSSTLSWTAAAGAASYDYELYTADIGQTLVTSGTVTGTTVNFTGLTPEVTYRARVRTNCTNGISSGFVNATAFVTLSAPSGANNKININVHYDGNGLYSNSSWNNWLTSSSVPAGLSTITYENGTTSGYSIAWTAITNSAQYDNGASYVSSVDWPANVLRQTISTTSGPGFGSARPGFIISGLNNAYTYDITIIGSRNNTGNSSEYQATGATVVNSSAIVTDSNSTSAATMLGVSPTGGAITIKWAKSTGSFGYLNAIKITVNTGGSPTCAIPTGGNVTSITTSTATLGWNAGSGVTNYDYEVYAGPISGTPQQSGSTAGTSVNLTGLLASTVYNWRYRSNCSNGVTSNWATGSFTTAGGGGGSSESAFFQTTTPYNSGQPNQFGYMYTPPGYNDGNSSNFPLIIFLHGSGESGSNPSDLLVTGLPQLLNNGQEMQSLVFCPQLPGGSNSWPAASAKKAYDWAIANFRVDLGRVYVTGLSLGASGTWMFLKAYPSLIAAYAVASGTAYPLDVSTEASTLALIKNIPSYFVHGDGDSGATNETNTQDVVSKINQASPKGFYPPRVQIIYNTGHNNTTWNDYFYDRSKTNVNFPLYLEDWFLMHNKDSASYTATKYVERLEAFVTSAQTGSGSTNHYRFEYAHQMYAKTKELVDALPSDSNKTALQTRYAAAKATIDSVYGKRYLVNIGATGGLTNINNNSGASNVTTSNLVDYNGVASTIGFTMNTQSGGARSTPGIDNAYWGLPVGVFTDGRDSFGNGGAFTFTGLNTSKTYEILIIPSRNIVSAGNPANSPELTATIGTTVKWMLGSYNMFEFIRFAGITGVTTQQVLIKGGWTLNAGVTPTKEITGAQTTLTTNVANYTTKGGAGALTLVILIEKP